MYENNTFKEVVMLLRQGGSYSTKELSDRFGVTQKTIQNYVKDLRNSGHEKTGTKMHKIAISFQYTNKENQTALKNVYPLKVTNMLGYWYLAIIFIAGFLTRDALED